MDTLIQDLHNLCFNFLDAVEHIWLNPNEQNNESYLKLISNIDRIYLAFKQNNYPWILHLGSNNKIDAIFFVDEAYKYKHHWIIPKFRESYVSLHLFKLETQTEESILDEINNGCVDVRSWEFIRLLIKKSYLKCIEAILPIINDNDLILYLMFRSDRFDLIEQYFKPIPRESMNDNIFFRYYVVEKDDYKISFYRKYYKAEISLLFSFLYNLYHLDIKDIILDRKVLLSYSFWNIISIMGNLPLLKKALKLANSVELLEKMMKCVYRILQYNNLHSYFSIEGYIKMNISDLLNTCHQIGLRDYDHLGRLDLIKLLIDHTY